MKNITKKLLLTVFAAAFLSVSSFAIEWGGVFKNDSTVGISDFTKANDISAYTITQSNGLYFWLNTSLTPDSKWYLSSEALYKYKFDIVSKTFTNIVDVDLLKITGQAQIGNGVFNAAFGRYFVLDNSASVFAQTCDGASLKFSFPVIDIGLYAGYTGLLNALNVTMLGKDGYAAASAGTSEQVYSFSHSYLPVIASIELPTFLGNQTLGIQASAFFDFSEEKYNRYYLNAMMKGPVSGSIFYTVSTTIGVPNFDFANALSNLSSFTFSFFLGDNFAIYAGTVYASGNNGFLHSFRGFTSSTAYNAKSSPELSGVIMPNLKFVVAGKVASGELSGKAVFGVPENNFAFNGVDFGAGVIVNCTSDLQLGLNVKGYYDVAGAGADSYYQLALNLAFAF